MNPINGKNVEYHKRVSPKVLIGGLSNSNHNLITNTIKIAQPAKNNIVAIFT
jgi:hypothetical protein